MERPKRVRTAGDLFEILEWLRLEIVGGKCGHSPSARCKHARVLSGVEYRARCEIEFVARGGRPFIMMLDRESYHAVLSAAATLRMMNGWPLSTLYAHCIERHANEFLAEIGIKTKTTIKKKG